MKIIETYILFNDLLMIALLAVMYGQLKFTSTNKVYESFRWLLISLAVIGYLVLVIIDIGTRLGNAWGLSFNSELIPANAVYSSLPLLTFLTAILSIKLGRYISYNKSIRLNS